MRKKLKHTFIAAVVTVIVMCLLNGCGGLSYRANDNTASDTDSKLDSKISNYNINEDFYEFIDPDTGVHYLVYCHSGSYRGMGGITPRLNADGSVMVDKEETTESK